MGIEQTIYEKITATGRNPFLFIGAGFTKRYLNTENWEELLRRFSKEFSSDDFKYDFYSSQVEQTDYYGMQLHIATLLEKDYNIAVLTKDEYKDFREHNKLMIQNNISPLKIAISEYMNKLNYNVTNDEIELLKELSKRNISGIITTNYDLLLETVFKNFKVFIGQEELIFSDIYQIGEIYKIHGSINQPQSLVLTSKDYKDFEDTEHYLIAKILTIFLEYPIIFLGYSINDRNILNILKSITISLSQEKLDLLKDRFIFVEYSNTVEEISTYSQAFENGKRISMIKITTNDFKSIYKGILEQKALYSPKILRQLREDIYNLAVDYSKTPNPTESKISAATFQNLDELPEDSQIILGIGVIGGRGYRSIKANEIYEDIILNNKRLDPDNLLNFTYPELLKSNTGGLPIFKYLSCYNNPVFDKIKIYIETHTDIDSFLNSSLRHNKKSYRNAHLIKSINDVIKLEGFDKAYAKICYLEDAEINITELETYLVDLFKSKTNILDGNSELKLLIRIFDFLKYKK